MRQAERFAEIDLLRFLAALAVMLLHYGIRGFVAGEHLSPLHFPVLGPLLKYNYLGVNLFFMISGFVILMTVQGKGLTDFFISRVARLYPAYWICCTLTFVVILLFAGDLIYTSFPRYVLNMTMLNGFVNIGSIDGPYWSLCTELKFYFLIGILVLARQVRRIEHYLGAWLGICMVHLVLPNAIVDYLFIPEYGAYFVAGCIFYLIHKGGIGAYRIVLLACSFVVAIAYDANTIMNKSLWYQLPFNVHILTGIVSSFYLTFFLISTGKWKVGRWSNACVFLGTISYPLYLLHNNIGMVIFNRLYPYVDRYVLLIATASVMILLARMVHVVIERPYSRKLKLALQERLYRSSANALAQDGRAL